MNGEYYRYPKKNGEGAPASSQIPLYMLQVHGADQEAMVFNGHNECEMHRCPPDIPLCRLAAKFTPLEVEEIVDKKDKLKR